MTDSAHPAGSDESSGGETNLVEAGLRGIAPAAFKYSKKVHTTDSLKATVAALRGSNLLGATSPPRGISGVRASVDRGRDPPRADLAGKNAAEHVSID